MNEIWERQRDTETGRLETIKLYHYFNEYLLMNKPRSLAKLSKNINVNVKTLEKYSSNGIG